MSSENTFARSVSGAKTGAPGASLWTICTRGADAERYFSRREAIALRVEATFSVLRRPSAYLFVLVLFGEVDGIYTHSGHR